MKRTVSMPTSMLIMLTAGCLSPTKTMDVVDRSLKAHREIPVSIYGAARSFPGADQSVIDMYEGGFKQRMDAQAGRIAELKQDDGIVVTTPIKSDSPDPTRKPKATGRKGRIH